MLPPSCFSHSALKGTILTVLFLNLLSNSRPRGHHHQDRDACQPWLSCLSVIPTVLASSSALPFFHLFKSSKSLISSLKMHPFSSICQSLSCISPIRLFPLLYFSHSPSSLFIGSLPPAFRLALEYFLGLASSHYLGISSCNFILRSFLLAFILFLCTV